MQIPVHKSLEQKKKKMAQKMGHSIDSAHGKHKQAIGTKHGTGYVSKPAF